MEHNKYRTHLDLEREGLLAPTAIEVVRSGKMSVEAALILGAYIDAVVAGIEPAVPELARIQHTLDFYVAGLVHTQDAEPLIELEAASVWAIRDAIEKAAKATGACQMCA